MTKPNVANPGCKLIKHVRAKFKQCSKRMHSNAHVELNDTCSHSLPEFEDLFATEDGLKVDKQCIRNIQNKMITTQTKCVQEAGQPISDASSQITNLPTSLKSGDKHALL